MRSPRTMVLTMLLAGALLAGAAGSALGQSPSPSIEPLAVASPEPTPAEECEPSLAALAAENLRQRIDRLDERVAERSAEFAAAGVDSDSRVVVLESLAMNAQDFAGYMEHLRVPYDVLPSIEAVAKAAEADVEAVTGIVDDEVSLAKFVPDAIALALTSEAATALLTTLETADACAPTAKAHRPDGLVRPRGKATAKKVTRSIDRAGKTSGLDSKYLKQDFTKRCAKTWSRPTAAEQKTDREVACLLYLAQAWSNYEQTWQYGDVWFDAAKSVYDYIGSSFGRARQKAALSALNRFDRFLRNPDAAPTKKPRALKTTLKPSVRSVNTTKLRQLQYKGVASNLWALCRPDSYLCSPILGEWVTGKWPSPRYPGISTCQYANSGGSLGLHACESPAMDVWRMYQETGDKAFYDLFIGIRDLYAQMVRNSPDANYLNAKMLKNLHKSIVFGTACATGESVPGDWC